MKLIRKKALRIDKDTGSISIIVEFENGVPGYIKAFAGQMLYKTIDLCVLLGAKNKGYGNSVARRGLLGLFIRIEDKVNRAFHIFSKPGEIDVKSTEIGVDDERLLDTVDDTAGYSLIARQVGRKSNETLEDSEETSWDSIIKLARAYDKSPHVIDWSSEETYL